MPKAVLIAACFILAACSGEIPWSSSSPDGRMPDATVDPPDDPRFDELIAKITAEQKQLAAPGVAVLVMEHGKVTFAKGFGVKDPASSDPIHTTTLFRIGSCTKMLTAAALMQLVASGQVSLDDPITKTIPTFALTTGTPSSITVRHLLTHSSGLADYTVDTVPADQQTDAALATYLTGAFAQIEYQDAPAGKLWNYSNPNFYLAGLVLERAGGAPYRQALHDKLFAPLGMTRTGFLGADVVADGDYAMGITTDTNNTPVARAPDFYNNAWARPAGFAYSSVYELAKFVTLIEAGAPSVLADAQRTAVASAQFDIHDRASHDQYGFGLFVEDGIALPDGWHTVQYVHHDGAIDGFSADVQMIPSTGFAMIVLANTDGAYFSDSIGYALQTFAGLLPATAMPSDLTPNPATFASLAGSYRDDFMVIGRVTIASSTAGLTMTLPDLDAAGITYDHALHPIAPDDFGITIQGQPDEITFIRGANGAAQYIRNRGWVAHL
jgi:CubicO group peptidase (beta-lactamase class C family)